MNKIDILYTVDHNYVKYMLISLYSLFENNPDISLDVHVVHDKFELEDFRIIESIISYFNNGNVYFYDFQEINKLMEQFNIPCWRDTKIANARIFFNEYIKGVDKLLYLDSDTVIVDSLSGLENYNETIHMVQDSMPINFWKNLSIPLDKYCNSGVLFVDVSKWKEENCDKKIIDILNCNIPLTFPDQDLINMALKDEIKLLPPEYNLFSTDYYFNQILLNRYYKIKNIERYSMDEILKAKKHPIILHSTPFYSHRPLEKSNIHPYSRIYNDYLEKITGEINNHYLYHPIFKLYLYMNLYCPPKIKEIAKKFIKK